MRDSFGVEVGVSIVCSFLRYVPAAVFSLFFFFFFWVCVVVVVEGLFVCCCLFIFFLIDAL